MQLGYTYTSRDLLRHSVSARRGMRLRIFDARRARSEHARGFGPDEDPSPRAFPGRCASGRPVFDGASSRSTRRTSARRATSRRAGADARARRLDARAEAPTCGGQRAPRRDRGSRGRRARARAFAETLRVLVDDTPRGALVPLLLRGPRLRRAHLAVRVLRHAGARAHQVPAPLAAHDALGGRRQDVPGVPPHVPRAAAVVLRALDARRLARARARAAPFALLSARLAVDLAREESAASVLRGRGPLALAAAVAAFLMDCERLHRFSAADIWENAHAHLATVALQAALTKAVERSARAFRDATLRDGSEGGASLYVADPMAGWVHFAHDVLNFPHLMTLCYGILCADAERAPAVAAVRGMRVPSPGPPRARGGAAGAGNSRRGGARDARSSSAGFDDIGVVAEARRALRGRAVARTRDRGGGGGSGVVVRAGGTPPRQPRDARRFSGTRSSRAGDASWTRARTTFGRRAGTFSSSRR